MLHPLNVNKHLYSTPSNTKKPGDSMIDSPITYADTYRKLPIIANVEEEQACFTRMLERLYFLQLTYSQRNTKTLALFLELEFPDREDFMVDQSNKPLDVFIDSFPPYLRRRGQVKYLWKRELVRHGTSVCSPKHKYSFVFFLDASKGQNIEQHLQRANAHWNAALKIDEELLEQLVTQPEVIDGFDEMIPTEILIDRKADDFREQFKLAYFRGSFVCRATRDTAMSHPSVPSIIPLWNSSNVYPLGCNSGTPENKRDRTKPTRR